MKRLLSSPEMPIMPSNLASLAQSAGEWYHLCITMRHGMKVMSIKLKKVFAYA